MLLSLPGRTLEIAGTPLLMGIVNATTDSFSDAGLHPTDSDRVRLAHSLIQDGARIIDIGGESGVTNRPAVAVEEEIERVVPLVEAIAATGETLVSVDTYKPPVAQAAVAAGADIINDVSGLRDEELAEICAQSGAALVVMHTAAAPKQRLHDPDLYGDVTDDVIAFLHARIEAALARGVREEQIIVDPGPDFAKTPAQTIELMRSVRRLHEFGRPILMPISRKDFIGALTGRSPRERGAGTLAALGFALDAGAHIFRMHDVAAAADYVKVRSALRGDYEVDAALRLVDGLRWEKQGR
jgi:dihydropteroate synthase